MRARGCVGVWECACTFFIRYKKWWTERFVYFRIVNCNYPPISCKRRFHFYVNGLYNNRRDWQWACLQDSYSEKLFFTFLNILTETWGRGCALVFFRFVSVSCKKRFNDFFRNCSMLGFIFIGLCFDFSSNCRSLRNL